MKLDKRILFGGIGLVILGLFFFTPIGDWATDMLNKKTLSGQSVEKIDRNFNLNDEALAISLKGYNGTADTNLAELRGKVVFINFWGSWCPPCVEEMPSIQKLYASKGDQIAMVLITMKDRPEKFVPYLQENQYTMPVYEANSLLPKSMIPGSFPTTYILNKKGEIVLKEIKSKDWNAPEVHELIEKLIQEN
ncbi:TlpA family protein disulfide reductase [Moheibacter lacus]|uniref:TlpA family protein disulfide reductase n=1 Tax=Moheibacter lacus TaxID=2745851 RepID=A0A838ZKW2_9FLAO|nr:TlpA disulfide reductase family protein [Moheibacter lacus]MBA5628330.1 TlpA family protein disulfide reductase [Moheibacter lacus]